jgi:hypothetical protein
MAILEEMGVERLTPAQMKVLLNGRLPPDVVERRLADLGVQLAPVPIVLSYKAYGDSSVVFHKGGYAVGYGLQAAGSGREEDSLLFAEYVNGETGVQVRPFERRGTVEESIVVGHRRLEIDEHEEVLDLGYLPRLDRGSELDPEFIELAELVTTELYNPTESIARQRWGSIRHVVGVEEFHENGPRLTCLNYVRDGRGWLSDLGLERSIPLDTLTSYQKIERMGE